MNPASSWTQALGDRTRERDHVVVRFAEQLVRTVCLNTRRSQRRHIFLGDHAQPGPGFTDRELNLQPQLHAVLVGPHPPHGGPRVARNHARAPTLLGTSRPISPLNCFPSKRTDRAAAYTRSRSKPTRVSTRPEAVTTRPGSKRVPA